MECAAGMYGGWAFANPEACIVPSPCVFQIRKESTSRAQPQDDAVRLIHVSPLSMGRGTRTMKAQVNGGGVHALRGRRF